MNQVKVGLIRVITTDDPGFLNAHAALLSASFPNLKIESRCLPDQPEGVNDAETERIAVPKILAMAREFEAAGVDAVFISCATDPGLAECRQALRIPVIGAGSACAALALSLGTRIGALGITEVLPEVMTALIGKKLVDYIRPEGIHNTLDLLTETGRANVLRSAKALKEKGSEIIALGCTGMTTIGMYKVIRQELGIQAIDPVIAGGMILESLGL
jgi:allantoin racemase